MVWRLKFTTRPACFSFNSYSYSLSQCHSGLTLLLDWRTLPHSTQARADCERNDFAAYHSPDWLTGDKLRTLGFSASDTRQIRTDKEVVLVLELNGAAYQQSLAAARTALADAQLGKCGQPARELQDAARELKEAENKHSRLFVVDAGLDAHALRSRYPDRQHYALVRGLVQRHWEGDGKTTRKEVGRVGSLLVEELYVPLVAQTAVQSPPFSVTVAFGQRLEPWVIRVRQ